MRRESLIVDRLRPSTIKYGDGQSVSHREGKHPNSEHSPGRLANRGLEGSTQRKIGGMRVGFVTEAAKTNLAEGVFTLLR